ncbi:hypothetical protein SLA2020_342710 [Shorea laevis]
MATLQSSSPFCSFHSSSSSTTRKIRASLYNHNVSVSKLLAHELKRRRMLQTLTRTNTHMEMKPKMEVCDQKNNEDRVLQEMYSIMNIVADREEMHKNIGEQRDNWNHLLLGSVNGMIVTAATMVGIAAVGGGGASALALKLSSTLLYMAPTGVLVVMNRIQPSQLAEEQRNASRLFKQLHEEIRGIIAVRNLNYGDVKNAMEKVLALDKAYPLPLLGTMLEKFPSVVQPAVWWPEEKPQPEMKLQSTERNGWDKKLEEEMMEVVEVLKRKDTEEYLKLSRRVLKINRILAFCGPFFTGIAAVGSTLTGSTFSGFATFLGVVFGALAVVVNTLEHGGQIGMVFEMYRSSAGFFKLMEETIESTIDERGVDVRENGALFEVKVALQLGRSLTELRDMAGAGHRETEEEFASKLF